MWIPHCFKKKFEVHKKSLEILHFNNQATTSDTSDRAQTSTKLTPGHSNPGESKTMEATTPELGPVHFWSQKSSSFRGSESTPSVNKSGASNFFIQHDKVEDSKLRHYLETFGRALEQFYYDKRPQQFHYLLTRHAVPPTGKASNIIT